MKMNNRVYGVIGVGAEMANWNADFTGNPRTLGDGTIFASDKAFKHAIKRFWTDEGERVLYKKTLVTVKADVQPRDLGESFEALTGITLGRKASYDEVLGGLFSCLDVENFGATFAVAGANIGIAGVVQIGQALNKFEDTTIETMDITAPFRNSNERSKEAAQTSIGKKIIADEAHYVYPFSVNPRNVDDVSHLTESFDGYTREAYEKFKEASMVAATALSTNSKQGAYNHFAIFVELKDGSKKILPQLDKYVFITREDRKVIVDVTGIANIVKSVEGEVEKAELFVDDNLVTLVGVGDVFEIKNIFSKELI